jgi:mannosyltransferase OCH1-like enzyme
VENRVTLVKQGATGHLVTKIIHQFWTGPEMPSAVKDAVASWAEINADYDCRLWNEEAAYSFLEEYFEGEILSLFKRSTIPAFKSDLIRYALLFIFGGLYVDTDMKALRPLSPSLPRRARLIVTYVDREDKGLPVIIKNDFLAARPGNEIFLSLLDGICRNCEAAAKSRKPYNIHSISGPTLLKSAILSRANEEFGSVLAIPRLDAKLYFGGVKINYDEIGGHWSEVQKTQDLFQ